MNPLLLSVKKRFETYRRFIFFSFANLGVLFVNAIVSLQIPKYLSLAEYGEYRILTLYLMYASFFQLGLIDYCYNHYAEISDDKELSRNVQKDFKALLSMLVLMSLLFIFVGTLLTTHFFFRFS